MERCMCCVCGILLLRVLHISTFIVLSFYSIELNFQPDFPYLPDEHTVFEQ